MNFNDNKFISREQIAHVQYLSDIFQYPLEKVKIQTIYTFKDGVRWLAKTQIIKSEDFFILNLDREQIAEALQQNNLINNPNSISFLKQMERESSIFLKKILFQYLSIQHKKYFDQHYDRFKRKNISLFILMTYANKCLDKHKFQIFQQQFIREFNKKIQSIENLSPKKASMFTKVLLAFNQFCIGGIQKSLEIYFKEEKNNKKFHQIYLLIKAMETKLSKVQNYQSDFYFQKFEHQNSSEEEANEDQFESEKLMVENKSKQKEQGRQLNLSKQI